jgi:hypothetical protein
VVNGAVVSAQGDPKSEVAQRFLGAWRYVGVTVDGKPGTERGANTKGIIIYDASGHMAVHVAPENAAAADHIAYFGTYSIDEQASTVTHRKHGTTQPDASDVVRAYEFAGRRLILRPLEAKTTEIIWERIA